MLFTLPRALLSLGGRLGLLALALHLLAAFCPASIPWHSRGTRSDLAAAGFGVLSHLERHAAVTGVTVEMVRSNPAKAAGLLSHQIDTLINDPTKATAPGIMQACVSAKALWLVNDR